MPTETLNGVRIRYEVAGAGEPVVLVHGSWGDHHNWDLLAPLLAADYQVVSYDRRGHSESEAPPGQGSVNDDVDDLAALIAHVGPGPVRLVGNSFGAIVSLRLASKHPELIRKVAVHEPPALLLLASDPATAPVVDAVRGRVGAVVELLAAGKHAEGAELFVETVALGPGQWALLPPQAQETFVRNAATFLDESQESDALSVDVDALTAYSGPALLSQGDASPPFFALVLDKIAAALPRARRQTLEGAGHVPHQSHPKEYAASLTEFLSS